jgi:cytochrome P450
MSTAAAALDASRPPPRPGLLEEVYRGWLMRTDPLACTFRMAERNGPVVAQHMGLFLTVSLFGPDALKFVLLNREGLFSSQRAWDLIIGRLFTRGLMLRDGDEHRWHRNLMHQAFTWEALAEYLGRMNPEIEGRIARWRPEGFHAYPAFKRLTLDLASSVFLGMELGSEAEQVNRAFEDAVAASMAVLRLRIPGTSFARGLAGRELLARFFAARIPERRSGGGSDMFSRLCRAADEEGQRFDDSEIVDHMIFLMMAAHDTTTSTLTSLLYALARHPEWQERVRQECLELGTRHLAFEQADRLATLKRVMNETLRRWPPLSTIPRMTLRDFEWLGHRVPAGAMTIVYPIHNHHLPDWWSEPFRFDPDRFSEERAEHRRHSHLFVPFGGGAHACLGLRFAELQIKAIVHQLVQRFRWSVPEGYEMPVQQSPISKPRDGLPLRLEPIG